jgi:AcrR family transcriptional regulator
MAWDTEGTKRKILDAATSEFTERGPDGTTIERIAKLAGVNKERVYNYYGDKAALFAHVLRDRLATASYDVPLASASPEDIADYAGRLYDYHRQHPELARLLQWEALTIGWQVPEEAQRGEYYAHKTAELAGEPVDGGDGKLEPDLLHFLLLSLAGYWALLPQVARMITGADGDEASENDRRRAGVVNAARRLAGGSVGELMPSLGDQRLDQMVAGR